VQVTLIRVLGAVLAAASTGTCFAQPAKAPAFEVVSVRPTSPGDGGRELEFSSGGRFYARNIPLVAVIAQAYSVRDFQIVRAPSWVSDWNTGRFDIQALAGASATQDEMRLMVRTLLAERFKLRIHRAKRKQSVLVLKLPSSGATLPAPKTVKGEAGSGRINFIAPGHIKGGNISMKTLIAALTEITRGPVIDETGFDGAFDFELKWTPARDPGSGEEASSVGAESVVGPTVPRALEAQAGLRLIPARRGIDVMVIEHVERPSTN
jgi:uncharacterized protein (TIGR03435 family)